MPKLSQRHSLSKINLARIGRAELEFLPAALEIVETPPSPTARATVSVFVIILAAGISWACIGQMDIVTSAPGRLVSSGRTKVMQPFETAVVRAINVSDGQHVSAGQPLVILDPTGNEAERNRASHDLMTALVDGARLQALLKNDLQTFKPPADADEATLSTAKRLMKAQADAQEAKLANLDHQAAEKKAQLGEIGAEVKRIDATMPMLQAHMDIRNKALKTGYGNQIDYYDSLRQVVDQQQQRIVDQSKIAETEQDLASVLRQRDEAVSEYLSGLLLDLSKAEAADSEKRQDLIKATQLARLQTLSAPVDGTVQQLAIHTVGGVVTPAQPLLAVVPEDAPLDLEVMVPNREIGFVHVGQSAEVKVETLEFTHYGLLHGTVMSISRDAVATDPLRQGPSQAQNPDPSSRNSSDKSSSSDTPADGDPDYVAHIKVQERGLKTEQGFVPLEPGMTVDAEIHTGRRRIIDYILSPLQRYRHEALTER